MKNTQVNNQQINYWVINLKDVLDQEKQSIDINNNKHRTGTLAINFLKPAEESNMYV